MAKLQPVPPPMPLEALLIPDNLTDSDCDGIGGGTGCNNIFFPMYFKFQVNLAEVSLIVFHIWT